MDDPEDTARDAMDWVGVLLDGLCWVGAVANVAAFVVWRDLINLAVLPGLVGAIVIGWLLRRA